MQPEFTWHGLCVGNDLESSDTVAQFDQPKQPRDAFVSQNPGLSEHLSLLSVLHAPLCIYDVGVYESLQGVCANEKTCD